MKYRKQLQGLVKRMKRDVEEQIVPLLRALEGEYIADSYVKTFESAFDRLHRHYGDIGEQARRVAADFVGNADRENRRRFYSAMEDAAGIDLQSVLNNEGLENTLAATTRENVNLIKSIPAQYLKDIESIVFTETVKGSNAGSMIKQISEKGGVSERRAKLIARDQTSKFNAALTQKRSENLGVEEYVWRTAEDDRVRPTHAANNGKTFRWDSPPPKTGHPSDDVQCRCYAESILKL